MCENYVQQPDHGGLIRVTALFKESLLLLIEVVQSSTGLAWAPSENSWTIPINVVTTMPFAPSPSHHHSCKTTFQNGWFILVLTTSKQARFRAVNLSLSPLPTSSKHPLRYWVPKSFPCPMYWVGSWAWADWKCREELCGFPTAINCQPCHKSFASTVTLWKPNPVYRHVFWFKGPFRVDFPLPCLILPESTDVSRHFVPPKKKRIGLPEPSQQVH